MDANNYQLEAEKLMNGVYTSDKATLVATLGLTGEAGEVANDVKKFMYGRLSVEQLKDKTEEELGDTLWYVCAVATSLGLKLSDILERNLTKLRARAAAGHPNHNKGNS